MHLLVSVEGGAEEWQRLLDQSWQEYQQSDHSFELTLADYEEMAEPDFSDDEFDLDIDGEFEQTEIGTLIDVFDRPNVRLESIAVPLPTPPRSS